MFHLIAYALLNPARAWIWMKCDNSVPKNANFRVFIYERFHTDNSKFRHLFFVNHLICVYTGHFV